MNDCAREIRQLIKHIDDETDDVGGHPIKVGVNATSLGSQFDGGATARALAVTFCFAMEPDQLTGDSMPVRLR